MYKDAPEGPTIKESAQTVLKFQNTEKINCSY